MRPAGAPPSKSSTPTIARSTFRGASSSGHDALDKVARELRTTHPHFVYTHHGEAQALHNGGIVAWGSGPKGEPPWYTGLDVVVVRDSKIAALYVFLNPKLS